MEGLSDQLPAQPDQPTPEKHRFDAANDFLTVCGLLRQPGACQLATTVATIGKMYNERYASLLA